MRREMETRAGGQWRTQGRRVFAGMVCGAVAVVMMGRVMGEEARAWPSAGGAVFAMRGLRVTDPVVAFDAKGRELLGFNWQRRGRALPGRWFELVCGGGTFVARDAGTWIGAKVSGSGVYSVEVTVTAAAESGSDGAVLGYGVGEKEVVGLAQEKGGWVWRQVGQKPVTLFPVVAGKPEHVVVTSGAGKWAAYRDGEMVGSGELAGGEVRWDPGELVIGSAGWRGRVEAVAVFPRVLTGEEVGVEAKAAKGMMGGRKEGEVIRFKGKLVRQAATSSLEDIRPYSRSLTAAEYRVEEVVSGTWKEPVITVLHWMIMDGKRLPLADRKPGVEVELTVVPLEGQGQLEGSRRDELADGDLDAVLHYCEAE
jgi:hypothetical protein